MARGSKPLYLGFYGTGSTSKKNLGGLLDGLLDGKEGTVTFLIPATKDDYTDGLKDVLEYADDVNDDKDSDLTIEFEVITDASTAKDDILKGIADDAKRKTKASDVGGALVKEVAAAVADGSDGRLLFFWPDEPTEEESATFEAADDDDVPCFNLCEGLSALTFEDEGGEGGDETFVPKSEDELDEMDLTALKKYAAAPPLSIEDDVIKGKRKATLVKMIVEAQNEQGEEEGDGDEEPPAKEEPAAKTTTRSRRAAREPDEAQADPDGAADAADEAGDVGAEGFNTSTLAVSVLDGLPEHIRIAPATREVIRSMAADFAEALVIAIANEVRRPKSAGKPREDGTPAAPKAARTRRAAATKEEPEAETSARRSRRR